MDVSITEATKEEYNRDLRDCDDETGEESDNALHNESWRLSIKLENMVEHQTPEEILGASSCDVVRNSLCKIRGVDKHGRPVMYIKGSSLNSKKLMELVDLERYSLYHAWLREVMVRTVVKQFPQLEPPYFTCVLDLSQVVLAQASRSFYDIVKVIVDIDQHHFPGVIGSMFIVNTPSFFPMIWNVVKKLLTPQIENKIRISSDTSVLLNKMTADHLPSDMSGGAAPLDWDELDSIFISKYSEDRVFVVDTTTSDHYCLPPYIRCLLQSPDDENLRRLLEHHIEALRNESERLERYGLLQRHGLRKILKYSCVTLEQPTAAQHSILKCSLQASIKELEDEIADAQEECTSNEKAVQFARNYMEINVREEKDKLEDDIKNLESDIETLQSAILNSFGKDGLKQLYEKKSTFLEKDYFIM